MSWWSKKPAAQAPQTLTHLLPPPPPLAAPAPPPPQLSVLASYLAECERTRTTTIASTLPHTVDLIASLSAPKSRLFPADFATTSRSSSSSSLWSVPPSLSISISISISSSSSAFAALPLPHFPLAQQQSQHATNDVLLVALTTAAAALVPSSPSATFFASVDRSLDELLCDAFDAARTASPAAALALALDGVCSAAAAAASPSLSTCVCCALPHADSLAALSQPSLLAAMFAAVPDAHPGALDCNCAVAVVVGTLDAHLLPLACAVEQVPLAALALPDAVVPHCSVLPTVSVNAPRAPTHVPTQFAALRSSLVLAAPPKQLDLSPSWRNLRSVELDDLASHGARQLQPITLPDLVHCAALPCEPARCSPPAAQPWSFDVGEADALRAAVMGVCGAVAISVDAQSAAHLRAELPPARQPSLRFPPTKVAVGGASIASSSSSSTWMATLSPETAAKIDRKYRPLSVAVQSCAAALSAVEELRSKLPTRQLCEALLAPPPSNATDDDGAVLPDAPYARRTFLCSSSVAHDLDAFLRLQQGAVANAPSAAAVTVRAAEPGLFGAWQPQLVDVLLSSERTWLVLPSADCAGSTDCHVLLPWLLESPARRVVCVRARASDLAPLERRRRFFADAVLENAPAGRAAITVARLADNRSATVVHADLSELAAVRALLRAAPRRSVVVVLDALDVASQAAFCDADADALPVGVASVCRVLALSEQLSDVQLARRFAQRFALRSVAAVASDDDAFGTAVVPVALPGAFASTVGEIERYGDSLVSSLQDAGTLELDASFATLDRRSLARFYAQQLRLVDELFVEWRERLLVALATPELLGALVAQCRSRAEHLAAHVCVVYQLLQLRLACDALVDEGALMSAALLMRSLTDDAPLWRGAVPNALIERLSVLADEAEAGIYPSSAKLVQLVKLIDSLMAARRESAKVLVLCSCDAQLDYVAGILSANKAYTSALLASDASNDAKLALFNRSSVLLALAADPFVSVLWAQVAVVLYSPACLPPIVNMSPARAFLLDSATRLVTERAATNGIIRNLRRRDARPLIDVKVLMATPVAELTAVEAPPDLPVAKKPRLAAPPPVHHHARGDAENAVPQAAPAQARSAAPPPLATAAAAPGGVALGRKLDQFLLDRDRQRASMASAIPQHQIQMPPPPLVALAPAPMPMPTATRSLPHPAAPTPSQQPSTPATSLLPTFEEFAFSPTALRTPLIKRGRVTLGQRRRGMAPSGAMASPAYVAPPPPPPPAAAEPAWSPEPAPAVARYSPPFVSTKQAAAAVAPSRSKAKTIEIDGLTGDDALRRLEELRAQYPNTHGFRPRDEQLSFKTAGGGAGQTRLQWTSKKQKQKQTESSESEPERET
jgi:hypothetical protein